MPRAKKKAAPVTGNADTKNQLDKMTSDVAALEKSIEEMSASLKSKKVELKNATKELKKLQKKEEKEALKEENAKKKAQAKEIMNAFMKSGKTAEEVMELLKK